MYKKITVILLILSLLTINGFVFAVDNTVEIDYSNDNITITKNKNIITLELDKPLNFKVDKKEYTFPKDTKEILKEFSIELLEGKKTINKLKETISNGVILIETNLGDILIDDEGIYFYDENAYKVDDNFKPNDKYKLKFKEEFKRLVEIKKTTENIDSKLMNLEKEILELKEKLNEKESDNIESITFETEQLELRIKILERELEVERNKKPSINNPSNSNTTTTTTTVQPNIYKAKGNLQVIAEVPKSLEKLKQDIFVEIGSPDSAGEHDLFYLSPNNGFKNTNQLEPGNYVVKSIYFLDGTLSEKYDFKYNNLIKVLENETIYFNIDVLELDGDVDELLFEDVKEETEDDILAESLKVEDPKEVETKKTKSKKSFIVFLGVLLTLGGLLIWKFDVINKIVYKE